MLLVCIFLCECIYIIITHSIALRYSGSAGLVRSAQHAVRLRKIMMTYQYKLNLYLRHYSNLLDLRLKISQDLLPRFTRNLSKIRQSFPCKTDTSLFKIGSILQGKHSLKFTEQTLLRLGLKQHSLPNRVTNHTSI